MKEFAKIMMVALGFGCTAMLLSLIPPKKAEGTVAAAVQVMNTPLPVTGTVNATINGTPTVNVASMPPISVGQVTLAGNVPVVNPTSNSAPVPLLIRDSDAAARQPFSYLDSCTFGSPNADTCGGAFSIVPDGKILVLEDVSGSCTINGPLDFTPQLSLVNVGSGLNNAYLPLTQYNVVPSGFSQTYFSFGRMVKLYFPAPAPGPNHNGVSFLVSNQAGVNSGTCTALFSGYYVNE